MQYSLQAWQAAREYEKELQTFYTKKGEKPDSSWHINLIGSFEKVSDMRIILMDKSAMITFAVAVVLVYDLFLPSYYH